jgi:hypothetical protein
MREELSSTRAAGEKVLIFSHIPPGKFERFYQHMAEVDYSGFHWIADQFNEIYLGRRCSNFDIHLLDCRKCFNFDIQLLDYRRCFNFDIQLLYYRRCFNFDIQLPSNRVTSTGFFDK